MPRIMLLGLLQEIQCFEFESRLLPLDTISSSLFVTAELKAQELFPIFPMFPINKLSYNVLVDCKSFHPKPGSFLQLTLLQVPGQCQQLQLFYACRRRLLFLCSLWSHQSHSLLQSPYPKELHPSLSRLLEDACVPWEHMVTNSLSSHTCSQHGPQRPQHPQLQRRNNPNLVYSWPIIPLLISKVTGEI